MDPGEFGGISYFGTRAAKQTSEHLVFELKNREADCALWSVESQALDTVMGTMHSMTAGDCGRARSGHAAVHGRVVHKWE